jgi:ribose transport system substrate-binding protein
MCIRDSYFPEKYGDRIIAIAMDILNGKAVPPAVFTSHQLITRENVDHYYPNDAMVLPEHIDAQLLRGH